MEAVSPERVEKKERENDSRRIGQHCFFFSLFRADSSFFFPFLSLSFHQKQQQPTSRRNAIGASLLFVGAFLGFSNAFSGNGDDDDAFFGPTGSSSSSSSSSKILGGGSGKPYRVVDGRPFVRTSKGDILSVGRLPRNLPDSDRTLALMGEAGLFLLRLTREAMSSVDLHSGAPLAAEDEFLTLVFATGDWEGMLFRVSPSSEDIGRIMRENGMAEEVEEVEELEAEDRALSGGGARK